MTDGEEGFRLGAHLALFLSWVVLSRECTIQWEEPALRTPDVQDCWGLSAESVVCLVRRILKPAPTQHHLCCLCLLCIKPLLSLSFFFTFLFLGSRAKSMVGHPDMIMNGKFQERPWMKPLSFLSHRTNAFLLFWDISRSSRKTTDVVTQ